MFHKRDLIEALLYCLVVIAMLVWVSSMAHAHDFWSNGDKVPDWVKKSCCGPDDVHKLDPAHVHRYETQEGKILWHIDGYGGQDLSDDKVLPSQDGNYWAFFIAKGTRVCGSFVACHDQAEDSTIYCFFVPMNF